MINQPPTSQVPEDAAQAPAAAAPTGDEPETFQVPVAALGGVQEGATVECKVVSIDQQAGTATLALAQAEPEPTGGTDGMADEFESPGPNSAAQMQPS